MRRKIPHEEEVPTAFYADEIPVRLDVACSVLCTIKTDINDDRKKGIRHSRGAASDAIVLFLHYCYLAKRFGDTAFRYPSERGAKEMGWTLPRYRRAKKILMDMDLAANIINYRGERKNIKTYEVLVNLPELER